MNVISEFDSRIWQEINYLSNWMELSWITNNIDVLQSVRKILSFYEWFKNKLINDNITTLCFLLVIHYSEKPLLISSHVEIIGKFFKILEIISNKVNSGFEFII